MRKIKIIKIVLGVFIFGISSLALNDRLLNPSISVKQNENVNVNESKTILGDTSLPKIIQEVDEQVFINGVKEKENKKYDTLFLELKIGHSDTSFLKEAGDSIDSLIYEEKMLLQKYASEHTYAAAYALGFFYFETKEYAKAIKWAHEARQYSPKDEQSLLLYVKACFYVGERKKAIETLEIFLKESDSKEAKELLKFYKGQE